jgi:hypothetical protein
VNRVATAWHPAFGGIRVELRLCCSMAEAFDQEFMTAAVAFACLSGVNEYLAQRFGFTRVPLLRAVSVPVPVYVWQAQHFLALTTSLDGMTSSGSRATLSADARFLFAWTLQAVGIITKRWLKELACLLCEQDRLWGYINIARRVLGLPPNSAATCTTLRTAGNATTLLVDGGDSEDSTSSAVQFTVRLPASGGPEGTIRGVDLTTVRTQRMQFALPGPTEPAGSGSSSSSAASASAPAAASNEPLQVSDHESSEGDSEFEPGDDASTDDEMDAFLPAPAIDVQAALREPVVAQCYFDFVQHAAWQLTRHAASSVAVRYRAHDLLQLRNGG